MHKRPTFGASLNLNGLNLKKERQNYIPNPVQAHLKEPVCPGTL
jgi:hypothetical protein